MTVIGKGVPGRLRVLVNVVFVRHIFGEYRKSIVLNVRVSYSDEKYIRHVFEEANN